MAMNTFQQRMLTANATAETFIHAVYTAWDSDRKTLEHLYRPASRIIWNGNPISGSGEMLPFIEQMPASKHDLQAFDCHPLPGATETGQPTISITVSGTVLFYNASEGEPAAPPPRVPGQRAQKRDQNTPREEDPDLLPRLFSHVAKLSASSDEEWRDALVGGKQSYFEPDAMGLNNLQDSKVSLRYFDLSPSGHTKAQP